MTQFFNLQPDSIPPDEQVVVAKYISDPLCIDGHKCDIRVYVAVTSFDPLLIYIYEEGLVRLATVKYDRNTDNLWNPCMHLCKLRALGSHLRALHLSSNFRTKVTLFETQVTTASINTIPIISSRTMLVTKMLGTSGR